ncbi:MAG: hypothetical protein H6626_02860 [Pseudobdellovibrionaceae bacterium]|nr:MAG: hypothetical protein H6626_02860 [Pseudobdellovibrionaceae bacterium]
MNRGQILLVILVNFISGYAIAATHECVARKSLFWLDADGAYHTRVAETKSFKIVSDEHETPYFLKLIDKESKEWGQIKVSTGTLLDSPVGNVLQAEALIEKEDGSIAARVSTVFDKDSKFVRASTILDVEDTDFDPNITLDCYVSGK